MDNMSAMAVALPSYAETMASLTLRTNMSEYKRKLIKKFARPGIPVFLSFNKNLVFGMSVKRFKDRDALRMKALSNAYTMRMEKLKRRQQISEKISESSNQVQNIKEQNMRKKTAKRELTWALMLLFVLILLPTGVETTQTRKRDIYDPSLTVPKNIVWTTEFRPFLRTNVVMLNATSLHIFLQDVLRKNGFIDIEFEDDEE